MYITRDKPCQKFFTYRTYEYGIRTSGVEPAMPAYFSHTTFSHLFRVNMKDCVRPVTHMFRGMLLMLGIISTDGRSSKLLTDTVYSALTLSKIGNPCDVSG